MINDTLLFSVCEEPEMVLEPLRQASEDLELLEVSQYGNNLIFQLVTSTIQLKNFSLGFKFHVTIFSCEEKKN